MRTITFDGYVIGDRLLEGVMFLADLDESDPANVKVKNVRIAPEYDDSYWHDLNTQKWLAEAEKYCQDTITTEGIASALDNFFELV